jgi:heme/copper-type cytochrome/quinol oxidase subunit 2
VVALAAGLGLAAGLALPRADAQVVREEAPDRREVAVAFDGFAFDPPRLEVPQGAVVTLKVTGDALTHSFTIDEYRIARRVVAGATTTFEFRADTAGSFAFYCSLTADERHGTERGTLVVVPAP